MERILFLLLVAGVLQVLVQANILGDVGNVGVACAIGGKERHVAELTVGFIRIEA